MLLQNFLRWDADPLFPAPCRFQDKLSTYTQAPQAWTPTTPHIPLAPPFSSHTGLPAVKPRSRLLHPQDSATRLAWPECPSPECPSPDFMLANLSVSFRTQLRSPFLGRSLIQMCGLDATPQSSPSAWCKDSHPPVCLPYSVSSMKAGSCLI